MEKEKPEVIFTETAEENILQISVYIFQQGYPERAEKYVDRLYDFGYSLGNFPYKYAKCRFEIFTTFNYRCAVFQDTYIFVYNVVNHQLIIYNVIHSKRLK